MSLPESVQWVAPSPLWGEGGLGIEGAGFLRPERALVRWYGIATLPKEQPGEAGFQVDRGRFDHESGRGRGCQHQQPDGECQCGHRRSDQR